MAWYPAVADQGKPAPYLREGSGRGQELLGRPSPLLTGKTKLPEVTVRSGRAGQ